MTEREALPGAEDRTLLPLLGNDAGKVAALRDAVERWRAARPVAPPATALPPYQQ